MTCRANILPPHLNPRIAATNGSPEIDRRLVLQVRPRLRSTTTPLLLIARENSRENVTEAAPRS